MTPPLKTVSPESRYAEIVAAFSTLKDVSLREKRGFGAGGLMMSGRLFATLRGFELLLKLPAARVASLVDSGQGQNFHAGKGTPMREWVIVAAIESADWLELSFEAFRFVKTFA